MKKKYHTFSYVLKKLHTNRHKYSCTFENRPVKYKFTAHNYGEIPNWYNRADGDPWDVFAPGIKTNLSYNTPFKISKVIGVFILEDGNHKIAVRLKDIPIYSKSYENKIIENYTKKYMKYTKIKGLYIPMNILEKNIL